MEAYDKLVERLTRIGDFDRIGELLGWDESTSMPAAAAEERGRQAGLIRRLAQETFGDDETGRLLEDAAGEVKALPYDSNEASVVRQITRQYHVRRKASPELMGRRRAYSSTAHQLWLTAREENDFSVFAPAVTKWISLTLELAGAIGYETHPYDGILNYYGTGPAVSTEDLCALFGRLRREQSALIKAIGERPQVEYGYLRQPFAIDKQRQFGRMMAEKVGYDVARGGISETVHPQIREPGRNDVRLLTSYHEDRLGGLWGTVHEAGHSIYEQGTDPTLPGGVWTCGIGVGNDDFHESQSRLCENLIGRSLPAWTHFYPLLQRMFAGQFEGVALDTFWRGINRVEPSLIRIQADEATYNLHVILRFEIENDLLEGRLQAADIPEVWRTKMSELLGITSKDDLTGALQDIHWTGGLGAFHFYTLGNVIASQLWDAMALDLPDREKQMAAGDFEPVLQWLRSRVHIHGQKFDTKELLNRATGQDLDPGPYLRYLSTKFGEVYGLA